MPSPNTVSPARRHACQRVAAWALAALGLAASALPCRAAESFTGLGTAFRPAAGSGAAPNDTAVRGNAPAGLRVVVSGNTRALASIDGRIVHVGDSVNGMRVARITEQEVVLKGEGGQEQRLPINPAAVKRMQPVKASQISNGVGQ